ncbi:MAG: polysaccharide deacetylase family protein [Candidatus Woesearchaeota archaeon]
MDDKLKSFLLGTFIFLLAISILVSVFFINDLFFSSNCFVSITFDDGYYSQYDSMIWLNQRGIESSIYVPSNLTGEIFEGYYPIISWNEILELDRLDNEVGTHGLNHINYDNVSYGEARFDLTESINDFNNKGIEVDSFAPPYGGGEKYYSNLSESVKIIRSLGWDYISNSSLPYDYETLPVTESNYDAFIDSQHFNNLGEENSGDLRGLILVFHRVIKDTDDENYPFRDNVDISFLKFKEIINMVEDKGCEFVKVEEIPGLY